MQKNAIMAATDINQHLDWAEEILKLASTQTRLFKKLAKAGYKSSNILVSQESIAEARGLVERWLQVGNSRALFLKARWFDLDEAATQELYLSALSKGYLRAAYYLGRRYELRKDNATAFEYYRKGAYGQDSACGYVR
jgi:TPR repeat protein